MILNIILNPILERDIHVKPKESGMVDEVTGEKLLIGDCGVYAAYLIKILQGDSYVTGFSGGIGGRFIKNFLDKNRIKSDLILFDAEASMKTTLHYGDQTLYFETPGTDYTDVDYRNLKHKIYNHLRSVDVVSITGKMKDDYTKEKINEIKKVIGSDRKLVFYMEGQSINVLSEFSPYVLVVDEKELVEKSVSGILGEDSLKNLRKKMKKNKIHYLYVFTKTRIYGLMKNKVAFVEARSDKEISSSAIIGGISVGIKRGYEFEKVLKLIGAIHQQIELHRFPNVINRAEIDRTIKKVTLKEVYNQRNGYLLDDDL